MSLIDISTVGNYVKVQWNGSLTAAIPSVTGEIPTGSINGINATFTTAYSFIPESVEIFVNGIQATKNIDYTTSGTNTINFTYSPVSGDIIRLNYNKV
jgi:hypothetical protein